MDAWDYQERETSQYAKEIKHGNEIDPQSQAHSQRLQRLQHTHHLHRLLSIWSKPHAGRPAVDALQPIFSEG